ncbi:hypothetical protein F5Y16DRAFT_417677 [Xylariaceae sp. FL0255]|nr:hypothetical protein F5Y16DRAFT_417677 [Xylariaceae sp. FL0255]
MKLIIAGATGLGGTELIKQALQISEITSVIALARRPVGLDDSANPNVSKLKNVIVKDYGTIQTMTVAVTPFKTSGLNFAEIKRVCQTCPVTGFQTMYAIKPAQPFRFIYFSAEGTPQDLSKKPMMMGNYQIIRGESEKMVCKLSETHEGAEVCILHLGVATTYSAAMSRALVSGIFQAANVFTRALANISMEQLAAAALDQSIHGFENPLISNNEMVRIGNDALKSRKVGKS